MALTTDQILDLVQGTQQDLGEMKWTDLMHDLQRFYAMPRLLKRSRVEFTVGEQIKRNLMMRHGGNARNTSLYAVDDTGAIDTMDFILVPWRHTDTHYVIARQEINMNKSPRKIMDMVKIRRAASMGSLAEKMEDNFWGKPSSSSDDITPWGLFYWIVANSSTGFEGKNPSGFSDVGGRDTSTAAYARFRNYTAQYTAMTKEDLIQKMRTAYRKIGFVSPVRMPNYSRGTDHEIFVNDDVYTQFEVLVEGQNENIGNDLGGRVMTFKGNPVHWVPKLDNDSTDPVYMINWGTFKCYFLRGEYMTQNPPRVAPNQHTVIENFIDCTYNWVDVDRRGCALISK